MKSTLLMAVTCLTLLAGCASAARQDVEWVRAGTDVQQRERDKADCLVTATRIIPGGARGPHREYDADRYELCMTGRGYARAPAR